VTAVPVGSAAMIPWMLVGQEHQADQHRETAEGRDDEGVHGRAAIGPALRVVPDQQVRQDGRELPEDVEDVDVVGQDEAEHGAGERRQDT
jgi:hypothetical protein